MNFRLLVLAAVGLTVAVPAVAGQSPSATGTIATATPGVDIARLPINLGRISRQIQQSTTRDDSNGLKIHFTINVYADAPKIQLVTPLDNLLTGDVKHSAPTHADMIQMMTPREFSPGVTLGSIPRRK